MSRRTVSSVVAVGLLIALFAVASFLPVPYVTMSPGPTVDVLAERKGEEIVQVEGEKSYPAKGRLELTTVSVSGPAQRVGLAQVMAAWFDKTRAVYPRDAFYGPDDTAQDIETESSVQMVSSQDTAIAVALTELGYDLPREVEIFAVTPKSPADGKLEARDRVVSVNGTKVASSTEVSELVQEVGVGGQVRFVVRRRGGSETVTLSPQESEDEPGKPVVGIVVGEGYEFPFDVTVGIDDSIGGPSAGLIFSLAVYDTLTPGSLTGGAPVAGTGTIDPAGNVGAIGGIQQKIVAAADSGAELFLVPPDNCESALAAAVEEDEIRLVKAPTMTSAVDAIEAYAADENADLPAC